MAYRVRLKYVYRTIVVLRVYNVWKEKSSRRERNATSNVATNSRKSVHRCVYNRDTFHEITLTHFPSFLFPFSLFFIANNYVSESSRNLDLTRDSIPFDIERKNLQSSVNFVTLRYRYSSTYVVRILLFLSFFNQFVRTVDRYEWPVVFILCTETDRSFFT